MSWWQKIKYDLALADGILPRIIIVGWNLLLLVGLISAIYLVIGTIGWLFSGCEPIEGRDYH